MHLPMSSSTGIVAELPMDSSRDRIAMAW